jgi:hypothetical protein
MNNKKSRVMYSIGLSSIALVLAFMILLNNNNVMAQQSSSTLSPNRPNYMSMSSGLQNQNWTGSISISFSVITYKSPNRQSYSGAFKKILQYLQVTNHVRLYNEFFNGSLREQDDSTWKPIQLAYDVAKNNFELNLGRLQHAIDDLKESSVI